MPVYYLKVYSSLLIHFWSNRSFHLWNVYSISLKTSLSLIIMLEYKLTVLALNWRFDGSSAGCVGLLPIPAGSVPEVATNNQSDPSLETCRRIRTNQQVAVAECIQSDVAPVPVVPESGVCRGYRRVEGRSPEQSLCLLRQFGSYIGTEHEIIQGRPFSGWKYIRNRE